MNDVGAPQFGSSGEADAPTCPRHTGRPAWTSCSRCGRPACSDCLVDAPVGAQCVDCVKQSARTARTARTVFGGEYRPHARPMVTYGLIGLCILLWITQWMSERVTDDLLFVSYAGVKEPWRFLTSCFIHMPYNPTHIAMNMIALWSVGRALEPMLGRARFLVLYLLSGLGGSVAMLVSAQLASAGDQVEPWLTGSLGASGAVFGLFGAYFVAGRRLGTDSSWIVSLVVINAAFTLFFPGIAWEAHLGGLLVGAGVMALLAWSGTAARRRLQWPLLVAVLAVLVLLAVVVYATTSMPVLSR